MTDHLSPGALARLAEGDWSHLAPEQRRHLAACSCCRDAVVEAAGTACAFDDSPAPPMAPVGLTAQIAAATSGRRRTRRRRWAATATVLPAAAVLLMMVLVGRAPVGAPDHLMDPIRLSLAQGADTELVFPGTSGVIVPDANLRGSVEDAAVRDAVRELVAASRAHPERPELAQWLVGGYLALDDLPSAQVFVDDALRQHRGHGGLLVAAGVVAYRQGHDVRADSLLTAAVAAGEDSPEVQFNRAVVQLALGRSHEAGTILRRLADDPDQPLAAAASRLLDRLGHAG